MSQITEGTTVANRPQEPDPFRFGWRLVPKLLPNGKPDYDHVPLTLEDLLHPDESCVIVQNTPHQRDRVYLFSVLDHRLMGQAGAKVFDDLQVQWDLPDLKAHSPDLSVFFDLDDPDAERTSINVAVEGVRPTVLLEIVSPDYRENDVVTKVEHYEMVGVPYYVIVDRLRVEGPVSLIGKRNTPDGFVDMEIDEQGRLWLEPLRIWIGTGNNRVVCFDENGRELGDYNQIAAELEQAEREAEEAYHKRVEAEQAAEKSERKRLKAERRSRRDKQALEQADQLRDQTAKRLLDTEQRLLDTEQRLAVEAKVRAESEERYRLLEEEMRRLRDPNAGE